MNFGCLITFSKNRFYYTWGYNEEEKTKPVKYIYKIRG